MKTKNTDYAIVATLRWLERNGHEVIDTPQGMNADVVAEKDGEVTFYAVAESDRFRDAEYPRDEFEADLLAIDGEVFADRGPVFRAAVTVVRSPHVAKISVERLD